MKWKINLKNFKRGLAFRAIKKKFYLSANFGFYAFFKVYQFSLMAYEGKLFYMIMLFRSKGYVFDVVFLVFIDFYKQAMINRHYTEIYSRVFESLYRLPLELYTKGSFLNKWIYGSQWKTSFLWQNFPLNFFLRFINLIY